MTPKQILDDVREALWHIEDHHNETDDWRDIAREAIAKLDSLEVVEGFVYPGNVAFAKRNSHIAAQMVIRPSPTETFSHRAALLTLKGET